MALDVHSKAEDFDEKIEEENDIDPGYFQELVEYIKKEEPEKEELAKKKVKLCKHYDVDEIPSDIDVLMQADEDDVPDIREYLITKPMRTGSGVAVIAVMTKPHSCPHGKCTYCPGGPNSAFGDVPQSYTGNEPATMRGIRNDYDGYLQVMNRLEQYIAIGQCPDKIELIVMGGTFPSMSKEYQENFVRDALQAMNDFGREFFKGETKGYADIDLKKFKDFFLLPGDVQDEERGEKVKERLLKLKEENKVSLEEAQKENETANVRCVGMTIETKPDWGLLDHGNEMLKLGCTRVEIGVQTLFDDVLRNIHRGHGIMETIDSIQTLKDLGFKLNFHMMPGLPDVSKDMDIWCFEELFDNPKYKPDMLKIYPTMVMPGTKLYVDYKRGEFDPIGTEDASDIIAESLKYLPRYCRIMRIQRDIPTKYSEGGVDKNNLRQLVMDKIDEKGYDLQDIKAREIGRSEIEDPVELEVIEYEASEGKEYFVSYKDAKDDLLGFVRVRLPAESLRDEITEDSALVRELHVYGNAASIGSDESNAQHRGFGTRLMEKAEEIATENGKEKVVVISGIGVREYYRKLGYKKEGPYMTKNV